MNAEPYASCLDRYAPSATYCCEPTAACMCCGVKPLDSLPAAYWNWHWGCMSLQERCIVRSLQELYGELNQVLSCAGIVASCAGAQTGTAIKCLTQCIATAAVAGAVKSSDVCGKVNIDSTTGVMTANGLGDVSTACTTYKANVVGALNEVYTCATTSITAEAAARCAADTDLYSCVTSLNTCTANLCSNIDTKASWYGNCYSCVQCSQHAVCADNATHATSADSVTGGVTNAQCLCSLPVTCFARAYNNNTGCVSNANHANSANSAGYASKVSPLPASSFQSTYGGGNDYYVRDACPRYIHGAAGFYNSTSAILLYFGTGSSTVCASLPGGYVSTDIDLETYTWGIASV